MIKGGIAMNKSIVFLFSMVFCLTSIGHAQEKVGLAVEEAVFCTGVENREAVGVDTVFFDTVERVFCFTKVSGAEDITTIYHVWYYKDEEKARVELAVKAKSWRTWSSKRIMKGWEGIWRVDVIASDGGLLSSNEFLVNPTNE
jgi:hypothetical protein